jgi:hypothetical protein
MTPPRRSFAVAFSLGVLVATEALGIPFQLRAE